MRIIEREAKSIYTRTRLPGMKYTINQYVGCGHGCKYCYARYINKWKDYGEWNTWIEVKVNAPELAEKGINGKVTMSSVSDPYQPLEKKLLLTRRVLERMPSDTTLSILTKSNLVLRDIDILKKFDKIIVGLTINEFSEDIRQKIEPNAPENRLRIEALEKLKKNGIKTYCFISPVIPLLTEVRKTLNDTSGIVDYYLIEILNTDLAGKNFRKLLESEYPESYEYLKSRERMEDFINQLSCYLREQQIPVKSLINHEGGNYYR